MAGGARDGRRKAVAAGAVFALLLVLCGCSVLGGRAEAPPEPVILRLGPIVTNLAEPGRYVRATVVLSFPDPEGLKTAEERAPELRDALIMALRKKTVADMVDTTKLKQELLGAVDRVLGPAGVSTAKVWLDELLIQ